MTAQETAEFLQTGDLNLDGDQLADNYDIALYRPISSREYDAILEQTVPYIDAEVQFVSLYEKWAKEEDADKKFRYEQDLERLGREDSLPLYQIYTNNCDHTVRLLAASVDPVMRDYIRQSWRVTPNGNLKAFGHKAKDWGVMTLGTQTLSERIRMFLVIF